MTTMTRAKMDSCFLKKDFSLIYFSYWNSKNRYSSSDDLIIDFEQIDVGLREIV